MNINKPPISEIAAMGRLKKDKATYNPLVLSALAECIHILPTGACVDLSDGEKALVLAENPLFSSSDGTEVFHKHDISI